MGSLGSAAGAAAGASEGGSNEPLDQNLLALALQAGGIGALDVDLRDLVARRVGAGAVAFGLKGHEPTTHEEWLMLLHPHDRGRVTAAFDAMLRTGARYDVDYRIRRNSDGDARWISVRAEPLRDPDGTPTRLIGIIQDITAQRRAEEALRENEVRLRLAQRAVRLGTFDWRVGVSPPTVSEEFAEIHGLPPGTREDPLENWVRRIHPDDRLRTAAAVEAMLRGDTYDIEYRIIRQNDGATRWIASRAEVFADEGTTTGSPSEGFRVIGAIRDVTERRQTENALRQLNEDLERRVSEEVAARQDAQIKLAQAQRMEALGQLAGGIAHDFNNILQSIQGAATLIERRPDDPVRVQSLARMALDATARGASVTLRLLAFSRQSELRAEAVDPAALLNSLAEMFAHTLGATIAVTVNVPPGVPNLLADRAQLETVIVNLATNGRDAMERGGTLTLAADHVVLGPQDKRVSAGRLPAGDYVRLRVTDTGTGMDAATLARASEPFFTTKPLNRGTGLGLAMARGFVEQSGGLLTIESVLGRGTEVSILFAATAPAAEPAAAERSPLRRTASGGQHILVIDDEDGIRETLAPQLEADGYKVATLHNGTLALDHVASGASVDLVVCDLSMPGANGIEVIHAIQTLRPGLPAILLTGFAGDDVMPPSAKGPDPSFTLLRKPIAGQALSDRIAAMLADRGR